MDILKQEAIDCALKQNYRQYLCGILERPQVLDEIRDESIEVGISMYDTFCADAPHAHKKSTEYVYVLEGESKLLYLDSLDECTLRKGDFARILPNTYYASKHAPATKILFIKSTCGNDKMVDTTSSELTTQWCSKW